jgi:iron(III) transport system permease protein
VRHASKRLAALLLAGAALLQPPSRAQGKLLMLAGFFGVAVLVLSSFAIGAKGWSFEWLNASLGELSTKQFGIGWGGAVTLVSRVVLGAFGLARMGFF